VGSFFSASEAFIDFSFTIYNYLGANISDKTPFKYPLEISSVDSFTIL